MVSWSLEGGLVVWVEGFFALDGRISSHHFVNEASRTTAWITSRRDLFLVSWETSFISRGHSSRLLPASSGSKRSSSKSQEGNCGCILELLECRGYMTLQYIFQLFSGITSFRKVSASQTQTAELIGFSLCCACSLASDCHGMPAWNWKVLICPLSCESSSSSYSCFAFYFHTVVYRWFECLP